MWNGVVPKSMANDGNLLSERSMYEELEATETRCYGYQLSTSYVQSDPAEQIDALRFDGQSDKREKTCNKGLIYGRWY